MINKITMSDEESRPTVNIGPYISKFVRCLHVEEDHPAIAMPFSYTQFGAVLMVDIVGFSQMTSIASSKGDVGAEMLSSQIGAYFDLAIRIIEYHGGDVVKFLGDALLVVFQADPSAERICGSDSNHFTTTDYSLNPLDTVEDDPAAVSRRNKVVVRRAVECSLELLARLSDYRIYLSEREFARKFSSAPSIVDDSNYNEDDRSSNHGGGLKLVTNGVQGNGPSWNSLGLLSNGRGHNFLHSKANVRRGSSSAESTGKSSSRRSSVSDSADVGHDHPFSHATGSLPHPRQDPPVEESSTRLLARPRPGPGDIPSFNIVPPTAPSPERIHISTPNATLSTPGSLLGFRKREGSESSSTRPGSMRSRARSRFLSNAKNLFTHSNFNEQGASGQALLDNAYVSEEAHELQLHMALSAGDISNIIIGDVGDNKGLDSLLVQDTGRLEYAICGEQMSALDYALNLARAGEVTVTKSAWKYVDSDAYRRSEPRRNCVILKSIPSSRREDLPLMRRIRNDRVFKANMQSNPHYFKYVNKSAIHRLILYPNGDFPAQFRNATILFVSLGDVKPWTPDGLALCQNAFLVVHKVTSAYAGFIQQFAVDDKGATILCAFGLPYPHSHEKEAIFAAKSAWLIRQRLLDEDVRGFKISLATGVIFTSTIGNEFRRDPAIVGDTIVIAVRILKFEYATNSIVCDDATMVACTSDHDDLCDFEDMGEEYVKGKLYPLRIWRLVHFGAKNQAHQSDDTLEDDIVGYESEREKVTKCLEGWAQAPDRNTLLVMGPRGSGKSMFHQQIFHAADKNGFRICSAPSAEVEQNTEYYPIKFLLLDLFDIMHKHDIPYSAKTDPANAPPRANTDIHDINKTDLEMVPPIAFANSKDSSGCTSMHTTDTIMSTGAAKSQLTSVQDSGSTMHSDGLLQLPAASNRPWHSSFGSSEDVPFSPEINQYDRPSGPNSTSRTKLEALINICLDKLGSNKRNLTTPVLYDIIAGISSDDPTPVIDPEEDHILSEFIVRTLNYACRYVKTIVMFRDIQWCDYKSLNIIQAIHERCPSVLIVLFSRPLRDYGDSNTLKAISNHPSHLEITLEGLRRREIEQALLRAFQDKGVTRISPEIMDLVQERTKGNPKFVKSMSFLLQEFCHFSVVDGELLTTGKETATGPSSKSVEEMLQKQDRKKVTLMQYDRLRPKFQEFLKVASCLGETFTLAEIAAIKPLESLLGAPDQKKSYSTAIIDLDTYRFLSLATNQQTNIQFSRNAVLQTIYTFTSPSTAGDIYESIPYEERVGYHLKLAQFYESFLEQAGHNEDPTKQPLNCQDLLPKITYHYMKTDHTEKKIKYLKALAAFHLKGNMLTDATDNLNELIRIMDTERGAREMVSEEDLADIYGMKGESLSKRMRIEEAEPALLDSLAKYGIFWPSSRSQWRRVLMIEGLKFKYCYNLGLSPVVQKPGKRVPKPRVDHKGQRRLTRIIRVLSCLQNVYFWRTEPDGATLSCFYTLKCSRKLGIPSGDQTTSLARIAIINYYQGNKHDCEKYMDDARRSNETDGATFGMFSAMDAYTEYSEGHLEKAHRLLDEAISESKTFGVVTHLATFYRAVTSKIAYRMWEGSYNVHPKDCQLLRTLSAVAIQNGDSEGEILFAIPTLANLLIHDRLRDAESWVGLIERYIMPKARLMNLLIVHGILSFYYAKTGNYEKSRIYIELLGQNIQKQGVGAHPFPLMSCMFALMAMYEMHDHVRTFPKNDTLEISRSCPFHADANLSYFIAYLKTEPMKLVAEPYICLADTMRSLIVPGHEREASQKLVQGYRELSPALEGLDFVMAYFLTQVGRYSEPELKGPCYQRAHDLFRSMSMNPLIWLTDPTSGWLPPTVADENRADFIMGSIPLPANTEALKEGSLGWAAAKAASSSVADLSTSPLVVTAISTPLQIPRYQDEGASASMDLVMSQEVQLDESSFHRELARASISSAPILHDMEAGLDRSSIETM